MPKSNKNKDSFLTIPRTNFTYRSVDERLKDYKSIYQEYSDDLIRSQASRCQDCGIPFCHGFGCPLANHIPDFNDLIVQSKWKEALNLLHQTSNFPEITGLVCPALCEEACTLNVGMKPVTIRNIELAIVEKGFKNGWIVPIPPGKRSGKSVAVIGSGPAGLVAAQNLNRMGHQVAVFEKFEKPGGFLRYGIPDFKLDKKIIDRRIQLLENEGVVFKMGIEAGSNDYSVNQLQKNFDAILITCGSRDPRDLPIEGRELKGIHLATDYLIQSNLRVEGKKIPKADLIDAKGKNVLVIGGGDTGADCIGTARRQGAKNILQIEILPQPPEERSADTPWPLYARKLRTSSSHDEGCERAWNILTRKFNGKNGSVTGASAITVNWVTEGGNLVMKEKPGTEFEIDAELILLAMGFLHPVHNLLIKDLNVELDNRGNIKTDQFGYGNTSVKGVFAAGDAARGASLVVWAFAHARSVALQIDQYLRKN